MQSGRVKRQGRCERCAVVLLALALGCARAGRSVPPPLPPAFEFPADTFAFSNETAWEYRVPADGSRAEWTRRDPRPDFVLRCGNMARAARQFHVHARFDASRPVADAATYEGLVRSVMGRDPRARRPSEPLVVIPGYTDLHEFSAAHPALLKAGLAGPWQSYVQRGNWRMIFPFPPDQQRETAEALLTSVARGETPIVHVLRFPDVTINHMLLVYAADDSPAEIRFAAYDPNAAGEPVVITWDRGARSFYYPRMAYFGGGPVKAYEIFDGPLY